MPQLTTLPVAFVSQSVVPLLRTPSLDWRVHSVYRQALNLEASGRLVAVAPEAVGGLPNGVSVVGRPDFHALGVEAAMAVIVRWPRLAIPDAGIAFDLGEAWWWSPRLRARILDPVAPPVRERVDLAGDLVASRAGKVGFARCATLLRSGGSALGSTGDGDPSDGALVVAVRALEVLRDALPADDMPALLGAADGLVGLGAGLTPSGDDVLVGVTAALRAAGHHRARRLARHAAARAPGATTDVARVALEHAARGEYPERLHDVLWALARGTDAEVQDRVAATLSWGASSGADTMLGIVLGLTAAASPVHGRPTAGSRAGADSSAAWVSA